MNDPEDEEEIIEEENNDQSDVNSSSDNDIENVDDDFEDDDYDDDDDDISESLNNKIELDKSNKGEYYKETFVVENLENNDSTEFLQKFSFEQKQDYIISNHHECLTKNYDDIKKLSEVIRNKNNIIVDDLHKTIPILTKYEKTKILGIRLKQLNTGSRPYITVSEDILDNFVIANKELEQKKIPIIIERPLPNNTFEYWKLKDLDIF